MTVILVLVAVVLAALRVLGYKNQSYQATAHLFVGGLFGAVFALGATAGCEYLVIAVVLIAVELFAFGRDAMRSRPKPE